MDERARDLKTWVADDKIPPTPAFEENDAPCSTLRSSYAFAFDFRRESTHRGNGWRRGVKIYLAMIKKILPVCSGEFGIDLSRTPPLPQLLDDSGKIERLVTYKH